MSSLADKVKSLIQPTVTALGFELWGVIYQSQGARTVLQVLIDGPDGINVDDCAKVSRQVNSLLDVEMPKLGRYVLEVSSPGLDRPLFELNQYQRSIGKKVKLKLIEPMNGARNMLAELVGVTDDGIINVNLDGQIVSIPLTKIHTARIVF